MTYFTYSITKGLEDIYRFEAPLLGAPGSVLDVHDVFGAEIGVIDTIKILKVDTDKKLVVAISQIEDK